MYELVMAVFALVLVGAAILWVVDQARYKACPQCGEKIAAGARKCPRCRSDLGG